MRSLKRRPLIAIENAIVGQLLVVDNIEPAESQMAEINETVDTILVADDQITEAQEINENLDQYGELLTNVQDSKQGLGDTALAAVEIGVESLYQRLGVSNNRISVESLATYSDHQRVEIALENIKETAARVWDAIITTIKKIIMWVADMFDKLFDTSNSLLKRAAKLKEEANNTENWQGDKVVPGRGVAHGISVGADNDPVSTVGLYSTLGTTFHSSMDILSKMTEEVNAATGDIVGNIEMCISTVKGLSPDDETRQKYVDRVQELKAKLEKEIVPLVDNLLKKNMEDFAKMTANGNTGKFKIDAEGHISSASPVYPGNKEFTASAEISISPLRFTVDCGVVKNEEFDAKTPDHFMGMNKDQALKVLADVVRVIEDVKKTKEIWSKMKKEADVTIASIERIKKVSGELVDTAIERFMREKLSGDAAQIAKGIDINFNGLINTFMKQLLSNMPRMMNKSVTLSCSYLLTTSKSYLDAVEQSMV